MINSKAKIFNQPTSPSDPIHGLEFRRYATPLKIERRLLEQGYYNTKKVKENFYKAFNTLGELCDEHHCAHITLRLNNKVNGIHTDWRAAHKVYEGLLFKVSAFYWGRRGRKYEKMPSVKATEWNKVRFNYKLPKEHLHIMIRLKDLKVDHDQKQIKDFLSRTCYSLNEVSWHDNDQSPPVRINMFDYSNKSDQLGNTIEYICKTTTNNYDPLASRHN